MKELFRTTTLGRILTLGLLWINIFSWIALSFLLAMTVQWGLQIATDILCALCHQCTWIVAGFESIITECMVGAKFENKIIKTYWF